jgi:hypothetical protein
MELKIDYSENFIDKFSIQFNYIVSVDDIFWLHLWNILSINVQRKDENKSHSLLSAVEIIIMEISNII